MAFRIAMAAAVTAAVLSWGGDALAQSSRAKDCEYPSASARRQAARAPQQIEGEVTSIDHGTSMVTMRLQDGSSQQFRASRDTLEDLKVGDRIAAKKREPKC
jgi:hypothetical protein